MNTAPKCPTTPFWYFYCYFYQVNHMDNGISLVDSLKNSTLQPMIKRFARDSVVLVRSHFPATAGKMVAGKHLKVGICFSNGGIVKYGNRSWRWKKKSILITAPHESGEFSSPDVNMLGIAIDTEKFCSICQSASCYQSTVLEDEIISSVAIAMWECAERQDTYSAFLKEGIYVILRRIAELSKNHTQHQSASQLSPRQLTCLSEYIQRQIEQEIRIDELAELLGMGAKQFYRAIESTTGTTPYKYILINRMKEAKQYLQQGHSVTHVAGMVGYSNPSKFTAAFARVVGCTPSHWKQNNTVVA